VAAGVKSYDVVVAGGGPGGSVAAFELARAGARVALVDKATFPRDKACGDLVGPRGVRLLGDLDVAVPGVIGVGEMVVVGPSGRRVTLPCFPGLTYPDHAWAVRRVHFDATLLGAAVAAGAVPFTGRAGEPIHGDDGLEGFAVANGPRVRASAVIGADGAVSHVAECAGLVDAARVLWGFALRGYLPQVVDRPHIVFWEPTPRRALPGYGWLFPGPNGLANFGLGIGTRADRSAGAAAVRLLPDFLAHLARSGVVDTLDHESDGRLGGWLKMGMVGTTAARGRVLLAGDAAGLVNPFQGEGIAQAMSSGRAAAEAILAGPDHAAERYVAALADAHLPFHRVAAATQSAMLPRPRAIAAAGRALTLPGVGRAVSGAWSLFWNELVDGAAPGRARAGARVATAAGRALTSRSTIKRWLDANYAGVRRR
jgi:geranylgeranyl reductase family protein